MANRPLKSIKFPGLDDKYIIGDESLSISGAGADSKTVGDRFAEVDGNTAPTYSTSATYDVGDYVIHDGTLYKCNTAITTAESWTAAHWTAVPLSSEVSNLKSALSDYISSVIADESDFTEQGTGYRNYTTGAYEGSNNWKDYFIVNDPLYTKVKVKAGSALNANAAIIAFYDSTDTFSADHYLGSQYAVKAIDGINTYEANVPAGCKAIVVSNRIATFANAEVKVLCDSGDIIGDTASLKESSAKHKEQITYLIGETGNLEFEQGGINGSTGEGTTTTLRIRSNRCSGRINIKLNTGYSVTNIYKYNSTGYNGKYFESDSAQRREVDINISDEVIIVIQKTDGTAILPTSNAIIESFAGQSAALKTQVDFINARIARLAFVQAGLSSGVPYFTNTCVTSVPIYGDFYIKLKDDYILAGIASYNADGSYRGLYPTNTPVSEYSVQGNNGCTARIIIKRKDDGNLVVTDDMVAVFIGGVEYETQYNINKKAVHAPFVFGGTLGNIPSTPEDVYAVYDSFVSDYPQFASKEAIGTTRKVVTFTLDSLNKLPITLTVSAALTVGDTVYVNGNSNYAAKVTGYLNSTYDNKKYAQIIPVSGFALPGTTGTLNDAGGTSLANYSEPFYGRCKVWLNSETGYYLNISEVNTTGNVCTAVQIPEGTISATSGVIKDEDGNTLANYSGLEVANGEPIYCYTFNFSSQNRPVEGFIKNNIFICGGVHGYEPKAVYGHMKFFNELFNNWKDQECLALIRSSARFTVIPVVNPWGLRNTKNYNARGVDINRNFTNEFPATPELYFRWSGDGALSEPEAIAVSTKMLAVKNVTDIMVDFHNEGGFMASMFRSYTISNQYINAVSKATGTFMEQHYNTPTCLFAWKNGSTVRYTDTPKPTTESKVYDTTSIKSLTISAVGEGTITVDGVTLTRTSGSDINHTNMATATAFAMGGMIAGYASYIGITQSAVSEVADGYYLTADEKKKSQIEITGNYLYALVEYFMT